MATFKKLDSSAISALMQKSTKAPRGPGKTNKVDTSIRTFETWFKMYHSIHIEDKCENESCTDERKLDPKRVQGVATVDGVRMCRRCFLGGYGKVSPEQLPLDNAEGS